MEVRENRQDRLRPWLRENAEAKPAVRILFRHQANRTGDLQRNCLALFAVFCSSCRLSSKRCSDETHSELTKKKILTIFRPYTFSRSQDPLQSLFDSCLPFPPLIEFLARDLILHETPMRLEAGAGVD